MRVERELKLFKDMMAFLDDAALDGGAALRGWVKTGTFKFSRFEEECVEGNQDLVGDFTPTCFAGAIPGCPPRRGKYFVAGYDVISTGIPTWTAMGV